MKGFTIVPRRQGKSYVTRKIIDEIASDIIKYSDATDYLATIIMSVDIKSRFKEIQISPFNHIEIIELYFGLKALFETCHEPIFTWLCVAHRLKLDKNITRMISKKII